MYNYLVNDLVKIFNEGAYLSITIDNTFQNVKLNEFEKKLYTKIIYGVVEDKIYLDYLLSDLTKGKRIKPFIRNVLRVGAYVINSMNVKNYYIVNELVKMVKKIDYKASGFVNVILRNFERGQRKSLTGLNAIDHMKISLSIPDDLFKLLYDQYGDLLNEFFTPTDSINSYRINTLKVAKEEVFKTLDQKKIKYYPFEYGFVTKENLLNSKLFSDGCIIAQDVSSMRVVEVLNPTKGLDILDTCSAPGGKSLFAATLMENEGKITSCDIYEEKLNKIVDNANKLGISIINPLLADATSYDYNHQYDMVICDVPCSGLGVIKHKPDLKYHLSIDDIYDIIKLQKKIINHAKDYVKDNGILMYSTCTINRLENELMMDEFIKNNPKFVKIKEEIILPNKYQDGFYICKLKKEIK